MTWTLNGYSSTAYEIRLPHWETIQEGPPKQIREKRQGHLTDRPSKAEATTGTSHIARGRLGGGESSIVDLSRKKAYTIHGKARCRLPAVLELKTI